VTTACATSTPQSAVPPAAPAASQPASTAPKRIAVAIAGDPHTFYQKFNPSSTVRGIEELELILNAGLSVRDGQGHLQPQLAEQVPSLENGLWKLLPDGRMETTWKIRQGALWHDGTPVTSQDALFAAQVGQDRDLPLARHRAYNAVDRVEAIDDRTVTVYWKRPYIDADETFSTAIALPLPAHLLDASYRADKAGFPILPYWTGDFVGTGPFKITDFVRGSHMILSANEQYVLGRPKLDTIEVRFIVDPNALIANVLSGTVDVTLGRGTSLEQALQARDQWREGKPDFALASFVQAFIQFLNPNPSLLANAQFRRALISAVDRQEMVDQIQYGLVPVAHVFVGLDDPDYPFIVDSVVKYDYDPRRSAQLIESLGYTRGPDGVYRDGAGQRLSVEIRATGTDVNTKSMFSIADYWQRVGVAPEQVQIPPQRASDLEYRATFPGFNVQRQGGELSYVANFHSSQMRVLENRFAGSNNSRYSSPELDSLIDRFETTIAHTDRMRIAAEAVHHITDQVAEMPIFYDVQPSLISNRVIGVAAARGAGTTSWNANVWDVK
jgi:peptide/nickel transport system substrate-binding protein